MPDKSGSLVKIWTPEFHTNDAQDFMDRYVDFHLEVMAKEPIDILANPTFLPVMLQPQFDSLWTERRMRTVIDGAVKHRIAIEINSKYRVPRVGFLRMAKDAGVKFSFGSNEHGAEKIGNIDYGVEMYRKLGLSMAQFFRPRAR
jgi:histidinol phosphatase-like PHP family hydrolase